MHSYSTARFLLSVYGSATYSSEYLLALRQLLFSGGSSRRGWFWPHSKRCIVQCRSNAASSSRVARLLNPRRSQPPPASQPFISPCPFTWAKATTQLRLVTALQVQGSAWTKMGPCLSLRNPCRVFRELDLPSAVSRLNSSVCLKFYDCMQRTIPPLARATEKLPRCPQKL